MKKIILIIVALVLLGCTTREQGFETSKNVCKSNDNLKDNGIISIVLWSEKIQLTEAQLKKDCLESFEMNTKQRDNLLEIIDGVYTSTNVINIMDESLDTNMQAFADPEFYEQLQDPVIELIKEKKEKQKIEILNHKVLLNDSELSKIKVIAVIQNEQGNPFFNLGIIGYNSENQEVRILFSSNIKNSLNIIEEYDLKKKGYDIYKIYHNFKKE